MSVQFSMNIDEAKSIIKSLPSAEYDITLTGNANSEDLKSLWLDDESRKINLTMVCAIRFLSEGVFCSRKSLASVLLPSNSSLEVIGNSSFAFCENLKSIELPYNLTVIGEYAFAACFSLSKIRFAGSVSRWNGILKGKNWSYGVSALCVQCTDGDVAVEQLYFNKDNYLDGVHPKITSIALPASCAGIASGKAIGTGWTTAMSLENSSVEEITVAADNENLVAFDNVLYGKKDKKLIACPPKKSGVLTVPKGYTMDFRELKGYNPDYKTVGVDTNLSLDGITEIHFEDSRKKVGFPSGIDKIHCKTHREIPVSFG